MDQSSSTDNSVTEKARPGPKPKAKVDIDALLTRVHNLEVLLVRMAHNNGTAHTLIKQAGLQPYEPTRQDMTKFKVVG